MKSNSNKLLNEINLFRQGFNIIQCNIMLHAVRFDESNFVLFIEFRVNDYRLYNMTIKL